MLDLLAEAMIKKLPTSKGFLIDGYPRELAQGVEFEKDIGPCSQILYFEVYKCFLEINITNNWSIDSILLPVSQSLGPISILIPWPELV